MRLRIVEVFVLLNTGFMGCSVHRAGIVMLELLSPRKGSSDSFPAIVLHAINLAGSGFGAYAAFFKCIKRPASMYESALSHCVETKDEV